jgi:hypothetical protein
VDKLHLVLVSAHGLVRGDNMELGRDADTGGQVRLSWYRYTHRDVRAARTRSGAIKKACALDSCCRCSLERAT